MRVGAVSGRVTGDTVRTSNPLPVTPPGLTCLEVRDE